LLEVDDRALPVGRDDSHLGVQEVDELALRVDRVDDDLADVVVPLDERHRVAARPAPECPPDELRPELVEVAPPEPEDRPLRLGVRREGRGAAEPVAPRREHRVLLMAHQDQLGRGLERGGDVAAERRRVLPVDLLHRLVVGRRELGLEGLLDERGLRRKLRLEREDTWDRLRVLGVIEPPPPPFGDVPMSWTSASLPIATVDTVILSFAIRRSRPWKSPRVIWPSEREMTCLR